jgi:hypothetical protein
LAFEKYGFIDAKIKKALVTNRREGMFANRADKVPIPDRISQLEDCLINHTLTHQRMIDIQRELKSLRG